MLEELNSAIKTAERKVAKAKMAPIKTNAKACEDLLAQAKKSQEGGDYKNAYDQVQMMIKKVNDTKNGLTTLTAPKAPAPKASKKK
jgi:hypothetical protein